MRGKTDMLTRTGNEGKGIYGWLIDIKTDRQTKDKRRLDDRDK